ncbi:MAG: alpha/beta hydrolase [Thermoplasmatales archaeon]
MERNELSTSIGKISFLERTGRYPVIFLHGLGGTGNSWIKLQKYLNENLALYFLDLIGHGRSAKPQAQYEISLQERALDEFISKMGFDNFALVGNSYGGWISLRFAVDIRQPDKIVLEDSAGINKTFGEMNATEREQLIERIVSSNSFNEEQVIRSIVDNNADPKWKLREGELRSIESVALIIWGELDTIIPKDNGMRLRELMKNAQYVEIKGAGHVPHAMVPSEVGKVMNDFLLS